jgi:hypothetical protein
MPGFSGGRRGKRAAGGDDGGAVSLREWLERARLDAYGPLGLKPAEFYSLLPGDLNDLRAGYNWRRERDQRDLALLSAVIMNASGRYKGTIRPGDLLQKGPAEKKPDTRTAAEKAAELKALKESMGHATK